MTRIDVSGQGQCNPGFTLSDVEYTWRVTAEDFGGNSTSHGWARIYWTP